MGKSKEEYVKIDTGGIDIIISKNDPWYPELSKQYPKEVPYEGDPDEDDLDEFVDYSTNDL